MDIPNIKNFIHYKTRKKYLALDVEHPLANAEYYQNDDESFSIGLYTIDGQDLFIAWGPKGNCTHHALLFTNPPITGEGCVDFSIYGNKILFREEDKDYTYIIPKVTN